MNIRYLAILPVVIAVYACSSKSNPAAAADNRHFEIFCEQFTKLVKAENYSALTAIERTARLDSALAERVPVASNAYQAWTAIRNATPSQRSSLYKAAAASAGVEGWDCPAVEKHGGEVGSE